jgi:hypothetical protein
MGRAVGDTPAAAQEPFQAPGPAVAPLRILVAEDNEFNAEYLERQLARQGHTVWHVNNGQEALAVLGIAGQRKAVGARPNPGQGRATDAIDPIPLTPAFDLMLPTRRGCVGSLTRSAAYCQRSPRWPARWRRNSKIRQRAGGSKSPNSWWTSSKR